MAPRGRKKQHSMNFSESDEYASSSLESTHFKNVDDSLIDSDEYTESDYSEYDSSASQSTNAEEDSFSLTSLSVDSESVGVNTPSSSKQESPKTVGQNVSTHGSHSVDGSSINTPRIGNVGKSPVKPDSRDDSLVETRFQTHSIQGRDDGSEDAVDESTVVSVVDSVIHSVVGNRMNGPKSNPNRQISNSKGEGEHAKNKEASVEQDYDGFMNELSKQSVDIMKKRSTGLMEVMSVMSEKQQQDIIEEFASEDNDEIENVCKEDLEDRKNIERLLRKKKYDEMLEIIHGNPKILAIQANQPYGKTFLHVIASMDIPPSEILILKVISVNTSVVTITDFNNNSPLHYAAQNARKGNMHAFTVFLKFHPLGASERNSDGDLPLHIVASNPARGAEEAAHFLLETCPKAISECNNEGKIPLHLAMSKGSRNLKLIMKIIKLHKFRKSSVDSVDNNGNSPLHLAILSGTKYDAINLFNKEIHDSNLSAYMKQNGQGYTPLHLALTTSNVDPLIIISLIKSAPSSARMPTAGGDIPVALATKASMKPEIVKLLLAADMPIELGDQNGKAEMGAIVERDHGHSWWHVAVQCKSKYVDVITSLLSYHATFVQIITLARCLGPDGKTRTIDVISAPLLAGLRNLLRFHHRYELTVSDMPFCSNGIQSFGARDHGEELERKKITGPWLNNGFTTVESGDQNMNADITSCEIEYVPWNHRPQDVTIRCYASDDLFDSETKHRENHKLSNDYFEEIIRVHAVTNNANTSFSSKHLCIAFEKSDLTLHGLMEDGSLRQYSDWLVKCQLILKSAGTCLQVLHNGSLVHGSLDATTIGQFGSKWKVTCIGQAVEMGNAMGGALRRCIPPEALSRVEPSSSLKANATKTASKSKSSPPSTSKLPPLPKQSKPRKKKFGMFFFGLKANRSRSQTKGVGVKNSSGLSVASNISSDSSVDSRFNAAYDVSETDGGSQMQDHEIARLHQALVQKEKISRHQLVEERAAFKREEEERQKDLLKTEAKDLSEAKKNLHCYAPGKVIASPTWDIWSFGLLMVELILGRTPLLPCFSGSDDEFVEHLMQFQEKQLAAICAEVRGYAGKHAADLVAQLLHPNPGKRIGTMSKIFQHKYFLTKPKKIPAGKKKKSNSKTSRR